ncbi:zinc finger protein ZFP2-like [Toxorhynchites rutilus septentrionalis]|uniref:zinc finger protein ZFP2-like n=1 Tax=Toxorhynchites rutilus septentrionalis TaxID=329112 RepID=UPI0024798FC0|nr:zinc finger protein ZFP2-like [Toxorhynchites rutilus septentrionalis]
MVMLHIKQFPNVCRMCVQSKPPEEMLRIDTSTLEHSEKPLMQHLNELTFEAPLEISEALPQSICASCYSVLDFVVKYRLKMRLLLEFLIAVAKLKIGIVKPITDLFANHDSNLIELFNELNLTKEKTIKLSDFLHEFINDSVETETDMKNEIDMPLPDSSERKHDDALYYNVEYIEEETDLANPQDAESLEKEESFSEFLEDVEGDFAELSTSEAEEALQQDNPSSKLKSKIRMLHCHYCKYRTTSKEMFQNHVDRHEHPDDENPWKCSFANCNNAYPTKDDLLKHKKEIHSKYVCDICGLVLKHKYTLDIHLRRHNGDSKYPCEYCSTSYFTSNELKLHMSVVHLNATDFQCSECGLAFKNKKSLILHQKTHSDQRSFLCFECNMAFKTSAHLRRHHNTVHRAIKFSCTLCPSSYGRKDKLRMHIEKAHNIQTYFPCDICLKSFTTNEDLREHKMHHKNPKHLECGTCLVAFFDAKEFSEHLCITYRDNYICCNRDFKFHLQYNKHMFLVHGLKTNVRVKPASNTLQGAAMASRKQIERCTRCEQTFLTRKLKKEHMAVCYVPLQVDANPAIGPITEMNQHDALLEAESTIHVIGSELYEDVKQELLQIV